jgi:hypothetical protein
MFYKYQSIELVRDINPVLKAGMPGVILEVWDEGHYEVEFLDEDGFNYEYNGEAIFTLKPTDITPRKQT